MINKQSLWFVTLFSLILVLSIYYVTMSDDTLADIMNQNKTDDSQIVNVEVDESSLLVALRVEDDEALLKEMDTLQSILLDNTASLQEKNDAYDSLVALNSNKGKEEEFEKLIKEEFKLNSFVKINNDQVSVVIQSDKHDTTLANNIIRAIQAKYSQKMYITVKFQK